MRPLSSSQNESLPKGGSQITKAVLLFCRHFELYSRGHVGPLWKGLCLHWGKSVIASSQDGCRLANCPCQHAEESSWLTLPEPKVHGAFVELDHVRPQSAAGPIHALSGLKMLSGDTGLEELAARLQRNRPKLLTGPTDCTNWFAGMKIPTRDRRQWRRMFDSPARLVVAGEEGTIFQLIVRIYLGAGKRGGNDAMRKLHSQIGHLLPANLNPGKMAMAVRSAINYERTEKGRRLGIRAEEEPIDLLEY